MKNDVWKYSLLFMQALSSKVLLSRRQSKVIYLLTKLLIFIIFGCIVIYCSNPVCWDYMFYFEFWNKSYCSSCKHLNSPDFIISKFLLYRNPFLLQCGDIESTPGPDKTKITNFLAVIRLSITCYCTHF